MWMVRIYNELTVLAVPVQRRAAAAPAAGSRRGVAAARRILSEVNDANIKCIIIEATSGAGAAASHAHAYSHYYTNINV